MCTVSGALALAQPPLPKVSLEITEIAGVILMPLTIIKPWGSEFK